MYCAKCGTKIKPGKGKCDKCGAPAPAPDYCGGFWGLLSAPEAGDGNAAAPRESTRSRESGDKPAGGVRIEDPRNNFWSKAAIPAIAAAALFLVITVVVSVRGGGERTRLQEQLSDQIVEMEGLKAENEGLAQTVEELSKDKTGLEEERDALQIRVTELEEENRRLMRHTMEETRQAGTEETKPSEEETKPSVEEETEPSVEEETEPSVEAETKTSGEEESLTQDQANTLLKDKSVSEKKTGN